MTDLPYRYFISYQWFAYSQSEGFGNVEVDRSTPIKSIEDTKELAEQIKNNPVNSIPSNAKLVILFWRRFEDD